jgi:hypothetical protein
METRVDPLSYSLGDIVDQTRFLMSVSDSSVRAVFDCVAQLTMQSRAANNTRTKSALFIVVP